jgi:glycosyltransferase involved in cell wall biosynthesis
VTSTPAVSILLLSKDHRRFLAEAIESAVAQTWPDTELLVVDNCSSDGSWDLIRQYARAEPRIKPLLPDSRMSISAALNLGLRLASGRYIAPMDSDDAWVPERLERQIRFLDQPQNRDVGVCGTNCLLMDAGGRVFSTKEYPLSHEACLRAFWFRNPICHSAALIRRECFERLGAYDESFDLVQDLELWLRLGRHYGLANLPEYLTRTRVSATNASLRFHRQMIARTLRARRRAIEEYGYAAGPTAYAAMFATWLAQWFPASQVRRLFNHLFLPYCGFLWQDRCRTAGSEAPPWVPDHGTDRPAAITKTRPSLGANDEREVFGVRRIPPLSACQNAGMPRTPKASRVRSG